jgi:DNA-binding response OmpR family regulator
MQKFRERDYDIVITDFSMPEMNGRDVAAQVKESRPDTIVLLATGWPASQIEAAPNGSSPEDAIIEKPAKFDQIYAVIRQIKLEE